MDQKDRDLLIRIDENVEIIKKEIEVHGKKIRSLEIHRGVLYGVWISLMAYLGLYERVSR